MPEGLAGASGRISNGAASGGGRTVGVKALVDLHLHPSAAVDSLWTTDVVATFAGGTFALSAGESGGFRVLPAGAIGFTAFTLT